MCARAVMIFFVASVLCGARPSVLSHNDQLATKNAIPAKPLPLVRPRYGRASWYGPGFYGRTLADGTTYQRNGVFVANRTLPLGTALLIWRTGARKPRYIFARVKDRGPFVAGRTLDLSHAAAKRLGTIGIGVAEVAYAIVPPS